MFPERLESVAILCKKEVVESLEKILLIYADNTDAPALKMDFVQKS